MNYSLNLISVITISLAPVLLAGCGNSGPPRGPIAGHVTIGGQPLKSGRILFLPLAPNEGPTVSAKIVDGQYNLSEEEGPIAGANRVEVDGDLEAALGFALDDEAAYTQRGGKPLPPNPIPSAFNRQSTLTVQVSADQPNTFDITVPGRTVVARPRY